MATRSGSPKSIALVTGGASGIGRAVAQELASDGTLVVVADANGLGAKETATLVEAAGGQALGVECDQTSPEQVEELFSQEIAALGPLDICVANAGWGSVSEFLNIELSDWQRTYDVNVTGTFLVTQAAARQMVASGSGGAIVVTSSSGAVQPAALFSAYCSAKAALNMLVSIMAYELGAYDIRVNAVMPGVTETEMTRSLLDAGARPGVEAEVPLGRLASPDDIAKAIAFLAGPESGYINGVSLLVDGGASRYSSGWFAADFRKRAGARWRLRAPAVVEVTD